tara:strand:+ start:3512 stop:5278 length:1767 start_codon:yes stop_codon:yes gene_type:complete
MTNKRKLLDLNSYGTRSMDLERLKKDLFHRLRPEIFTFDTMHEFHYQALKYIKPINRQVKDSPESILKGINLIVDYYFGSRKKIRISKLTDEGFKPLPQKERNVVKDFHEWILGFDKVPKHQLNLLLPNVKDDLKEINELIKHYEEQPEVQKFLQDRETGRNHGTKRLLDFYVRCLKERQDILDYYLDGVYERAIDRSRAKIFSFAAFDIVDSWRDYPYETGRGAFGRTMDHRKIDCISHRIMDMYIDEIPEFENLYKHDKEKFYRVLFKRKSRDEIFESIFFNLEHIPLTKDRKPIFHELKKLFTGRKWLAFYALALPQVEGLFAEMVLSINPKSGVISKALPDKVKLVRSDYGLSSSYFDYYEYELPNQRNQFSHTGFTDEHKLRAYDILTDLEHVLSAFASLENPLVSLTKIIRRPDSMKFGSYKEFGNYFDLLDGLLPEHKSDEKLKKEIEDFKEDYLKTSCSIEYIIEEAARAIDPKTSKFWVTIQNYLVEFDFPDEWHKAHKQKLKQLLSNPDFKDRAEDLFRFNSEVVEEVIALGVFFRGIEKYIYSEIPESLKPFLNHWNDKMKFIKWVDDFQKMVLPEN